MLITPVPASITILWILPVVAWWSLQVLVLPAGSENAFAVASTAAIQLVLALQFAVVCLFSAGWGSADVAALTQGGIRHALMLSFSALVPAWPLLLTLCVGTGFPLRHILYTQLLVLFAGTLFMVVGCRLATLPTSENAVRTMQAGLGAVAGLAAWRAAPFLMPWTS